MPPFIRSSPSLLLVSLAVFTLTACSIQGAGPVSSTANAPHVPPPIHRRSPATVHVELNASTKMISLATGVLYNAWTFGGSVPGPFIRARVGDTLDVLVTNNDAMGMAHNLDFHAVTGPGGGGAVTLTGVDERKSARFLLQYEGLFVYHCGTAPVTDHLANGMYGLLLVEPKGGLQAVDREYYVMQSEFYTKAPNPNTMVAEYSHEAGLREDPSYIVFNGDSMSLMGNRALTATTGETIRIYFGNAGPNKIASFHMVGMVMESVYREGDLVSEPAHNLQTTLVPPGGAAVLEFAATVPGMYTFIDHAIFRTERGAAGLLKVTGGLRPDIYGGDAVYDPMLLMRH